MSSIRPLITITLIVAAGVYFFNKINQGHVPLPAQADASLEEAPPFEVPPLAGGAAPAPSWNDSQTLGAESTPLTPASSPTTLKAEVPSPQSLSTESAELPPVPELPPVTTTEPVTAPAEPSQPLPLPQNIPVAKYPGEAPNPGETTNPGEATTPAAPVAQAMTPPAPITSVPPALATEQTPLPQVADAAATAAPPTTVPVAPVDDRYGAATVPDTAPISTTAAAAESAPAPSSPTFASAWPEIQGALDRQELVAAHAMLSRWYGNPTLTSAETQQIETLLSQLAGTIVYSTEHRLEPPYTVKPGDTLQTIAQQYEVPWQLLAKINGIADPNAVQVGQQLKVVHGPFAAIVELDKSQLTLMLDGRYAGRFPASIEPGANVSEGTWVLDQKLVQPRTQDSTTASPSSSPTLEHVLVLRNESPTAAGATIAITGGPSTPSGPSVDAPTIQLSPRDVEEVADILSVGSTVTIRR